MSRTDTPGFVTMYGTIVRRRRNRSSRDSAMLAPGGGAGLALRRRGNAGADLLQPFQHLAAQRLGFDELDALAEGAQPRHEPGAVGDRDPGRGVTVAPPRQAQPRVAAFDPPGGGGVEADQGIDGRGTLLLTDEGRHLQRLLRAEALRRIEIAPRAPLVA